MAATAETLFPANRPHRAGRRRLIVGWLAALGASLLVVLSPLAGALDRALLDLQFVALRALAPQSAALDPVVVGIDEASLAAAPEPLALWHRRWAGFLAAMEAAGPRAVGMDVVLPERSYDEWLPGGDLLLVRALVGARRAFPLVVAVTVESDGRVRKLHAPLAAAAGKTGFALWRMDPDHSVRGFDEGLGEGGATVATFSGELARALGFEPRAGLIDWSRGAPFGYVPLAQVLEWHEAGGIARLRDAFGGRVVLLGSVVPFSDRHRVPAPMAAWEPGVTAVPGVLIHAQAVRAMAGGFLIAPVPGIATLALAAALASLWWLGLRPVAAVVLWSLLTGAILVGSTFLLRGGWHLPPVALLAAAALGLGGRAVLDAAAALAERLRLRAAFAPYVSPPVLEQILDGRLHPGTAGGARTDLCVLFADVRNFTARSETLPPEAVIALLNRYFETVTEAIHAHGGTVDKFIGDGIMAFFGAPTRTGDECARAVAAAREMLTRVETLNRGLAAEGLAPIAIGIGINRGEAIVGHVGSSRRHEYTAIGDTVNVASRLEGLTKEVGCPLVAAASVVERLGPDHGFTCLGPRALKGHSPVEVWGWEGGADVSKDA